MNVSTGFSAEFDKILESIFDQMKSRGVRAANELRNAELLVLRGQRSGRIYRIPGTKRRYRASAPGEPPASRTRVYRLRWEPKSFWAGGEVTSRIESDTRTENGKYLLGDLLEEGTSKMAPRPHKERIQQRAMPKVMRIYREPYF